MPRILGTIVLTPQPGYPQLDGEEGNETITMKYTCAEAELASLPDYNMPFMDSSYPFFVQNFPYCTLQTKKINRFKSGEAYDVELVYKTDSTKAGNPGIVEEEWDYDNQELQVPIQQHLAYRKKWDHDLHGLIDSASAGTPPEWYAEAGKDHFVPEDQANTYKWVKHGEKPETGWYIPFPATKPSVEAYLSGVIRVNCIKRSTNKKKLTTDAQNDFKPEVPADTFDLPENAEKWLRGGSNIKKEGRHWVLTVSYLYFKDNVDADIYPGQQS